MTAVESKGRAARPWLPLTVLTLTVVAASGAALGRWLDPTQRAGASPFCDPALPPVTVGAPVPPFVAVDQDGATVTNRHFHGSPWISDFIFTSCTASCPALTGRLVALQRRLAGRAVRFVSFSVDPRRDTPAVMKAYAARWRGDPRRWRLLSTDRDTLARLGAALGGAEEASPSAPFHSDRFALVDGGGRVLGVYSSSSDAELERLQRDLQAALPAHEAPADGKVTPPAGARPP